MILKTVAELIWTEVTEDQDFNPEHVRKTGEELCCTYPLYVITVQGTVLNTGLFIDP